MTRIAEVTNGPWTGLIGEVVKETRRMLYIRKHDGNGNAVVAKDRAIITTVATQVAPQIIPNDTPADFSHSGLGIGGLSAFEEPLIVPSLEAIERVQRLHDTDTVCKRCGASKNFDGAMFTTGGGSVCDDCF